MWLRHSLEKLDLEKLDFVRNENILFISLGDKSSMYYSIWGKVDRFLKFIKIKAH